MFIFDNYFIQIMKYFQAVLISLSVLLFSPLHGQKSDGNYSVAKTAMLIDSLESRMADSADGNNLNIIYELSLLYKQVDVSKSKKLALHYLKISNSSPSVIKRKSIYRLLAYISDIQGDIDSSYYYLTLQANLSDKVLHENNEALKIQYLGNVDKKSISSSYSGLLKALIILVILLVTLLIIVIIFFLNTNKRHNKVIVDRNRKLEVANTKLKEFNSIVNQGVISNTSDISIKLEKSNSSIIDLRKSLKKAEESNYLKNTFLGSMSHQIRTPLSGIMGFSEMLETELAVIGNEELFDFAKSIRESGEKLMSLISNIFDISSIEANILEINILPCNANKIIREVEKSYIFKAKEKGLIYKTKLDEGLQMIEADNNCLVKVLNIVIDNSIRYTTKGFVTISTIQNTNNTVTIKVSDKGVGIDDGMLKSLYESFDYKKHGSLLTYQNSGLGLILAHRFIELMSGTLEITSKVNVGTDVSIILPCAGKKTDNEVGTNAVRNNETSIVSAPELGRIKIFIVEDDRMNRLVLEKMLKKSGEIVTAVDGDDTLKILEKNTKPGKLFDIMLFDINLPSPWDGIKLMHEVKKRFPMYKDVPFIAQTAYAMAYDKDTYIDAGFNDYIAKPIIKTELLTMIQKQLELLKNK